MVMINERGVYACIKCGHNYFEKKHQYKLSTDHKQLRNQEEAPIKEIKFKWFCTQCGEVLDLERKST